jgi:curved DNA-binding protein
MAIEYKDYYEILGVAPGAGDEEIRSAFRRLARMYHPDKTGNNREAEDRFKEINEAYEVLSDPERRDRYDNFTGAWQSGREQAWSDFGRSDGGRPNHFQFDRQNFSDFFGQLFNGRGGARNRTGPEPKAPKEKFDGRGDDLETDLRVTLDEVLNGAARTITMKRSSKCQACLGMGQVSARPCEQCSGKGEVLRNEAVTVKIPKGIKEGAFLRVPGRGEPGIANAPAGDLYLKVQYAAHPDFHLEQGILVHDLALAPWEAVLGATINVPTLTGNTNIKVPPGTQNGAKLRIKGRGLPNSDATTGDLILNVIIQVPATTALRERQLWEELARESIFHPRQS